MNRLSGDLTLACVCLAVGFGLAGLVFSGGGGASAMDRDAPQRVTTSDLPRAGVDPQQGAESDGAEAKEAYPPMDAKRIAEFAQRFGAIEGTSERVAAALDWFDSFGEDDFEPFVTLLFAIDEGEEPFDEADLESVGLLVEWIFGDHEVVGAYFGECWARTAPDALVRTLSSLPPEQAVNIGVYVLPYLWARDAEMAQQAFADLRQRDPEEFEDMFDEDEFVHHLYQASEVAGMRWAVEHGTEDIWVDDLLENGISDGRGVLQELMRLPTEEDRREEALYVFFEIYGYTDPSRAKDLLGTIRSELEDELHDELRAMTEMTWVMEDPAARINVEAEDYDVDTVIDDWLLRDPEAVREWFQTLEDPELRDAFGQLVASNLSELPFDFAIEHAAEVELWNPLFQRPHSWETALSDEQLARVIENNPAAALHALYRRDPAAALEIASAEGHGNLIVRMADQLDGNEVRERWFGELPDDLGHMLEGKFFEEWAMDDPVAAFTATADDLPFGATSAVQQWLRFEDAEAVYAGVGERFGDNPTVQDTIIDAWVARDPQTAGETLLADGHGEALPNLIEHWAARDSVEASRFIRETLEPGRERDLAAQALAQSIATRDPDAADEWAASIADEELRAETQKNLVRLRDGT